MRARGYAAGAPRWFLARTKESISRVAESWQDIAGRVQFSVEGSGDDGDIRVIACHARHAFRRGDEAEKPNTRGANGLEPRDGRRRAPAGGEHRIQHEKLALGCVGGNLEVVIDGPQRIVITVQTDVAHAGGRNQSQDPVDHAKPGPQDRHQHQLLAGHANSGGRFERRVHGAWFQREPRGRFVGHEHRDFVHELLEDLGWRLAIPEQRDLVLHQRMPHDTEIGVRRGGGHMTESSIFAGMKEYQAVIVRLSRRTREDEDALTDLLNERSRGGWQPELMSQDAERVTVIFSRRAEQGR